MALEVIVGVDVGISGALVAVDGSRIESVLDMPTITVNKKSRVDGYTICAWLIELGPVDLVVVEEVAARPGAGVAGMFNFGQGVGTIHGLLIALDRPWRTVRPNAWTKALAVGPDKGKHRETAQRLFPMHADLFKRVKDDGRADAALIAVHAQKSQPLVESI